MMTSPVSSLLMGQLGEIPAHAADDPAQLKKVAAEFESLLLAQMLKSARESCSGGWSGEEEESGSTMIEIAEQQLARLMAAKGGVGLAKLVVSGLAGSRSVVPGEKHSHSNR